MSKEIKTEEVTMEELENGDVKCGDIVVQNKETFGSKVKNFGKKHGKTMAVAGLTFLGGLLVGKVCFTGDDEEYIEYEYDEDSYEDDSVDSETE